MGSDHSCWGFTKSVSIVSSDWRIGYRIGTICWVQLLLNFLSSSIKVLWLFSCHFNVVAFDCSGRSFLWPFVFNSLQNTDGCYSCGSKSHTFGHTRQWYVYSQLKIESNKKICMLDNCRYFLAFRSTVESFSTLRILLPFRTFNECLQERFSKSSWLQQFKHFIGIRESQRLDLCTTFIMFLPPELREKSKTKSVNEIRKKNNI